LHINEYIQVSKIRHMQNDKQHSGFTIIEVLVAIAVLGVVLTIAVPSFSALITSNRMVSEVNDLVSNLHFARSEAIKRGLPVSVCQSGTSPNCDNPAGDWEQGWIVVVNDGAGGVPQTVLKSFAGFKGNDRFTGNGNATDVITFDRNGFALTSAGTLTLCDSDNTTQFTRAITVAASGNVSLERDTDNDGNVDVDGVNVTCP